MSATPAAPDSGPGIREVRRFWNEHPLFTGESGHAAGGRDFFDEHRRIVLAEHSGRIDPIFYEHVHAGADVVDVGCGIGFWVETLAATGASVAACDLTDAAVAITKQRLQLYGIDATVCVGNAEQLPYADASFDHVNCQGVVHHTPDPAACMAEFARILAPGGTLCFSVYYRTAALRWPWLFRAVTALARRWIRVPGRGREGMLGASSPEELVRMYDGADNPIGRAYSRADVRRLVAPHFRIVETRRIGFPRRFVRFAVPDRWHRRLSGLFGLMIVMRCEKVRVRAGRASENGRQAADGAALPGSAGRN